MTKKDLSQLYYLNREIEEQQRRVKELEELSTSCTAQITGMPKANGISDKIARYVTEIADLKALIDLNLKKCFYELNRLNRYINSIDDSEIRTIMSLRYISGCSWQQIAFSIGYQDESVPRKRHNRFLSKSKK